MSTDSNDLKFEAADVLTVLKPIEALATALRDLGTSHRQQADIATVRLWYTDQQRSDVIAQLDSARRALDFADGVMELVVRRRSDQRSFEQYAQARGEEEAHKAFTSEEEAQAMVKSCRSDLERIKWSHPVVSRLHAQVRGW
jgi:predicted CopG family antitoxin